MLTSQTERKLYHMYDCKCAAVVYQRHQIPSTLYNAGRYFSDFL